MPLRLNITLLFRYFRVGTPSPVVFISHDSGSAKP